MFVAQVFVLKSSSKTTHTVGTNNKYTTLLSSTITIIYISSTHSTFESKASKKAVTVAKAMMEEEAFEEYWVEYSYKRLSYKETSLFALFLLL